MYNVMLIDDEKLIIQGLTNIIEWEEIGLKVVETALNGYEALEKFKEKSVDIIITDISMPRLTGLELIKEIREINSKTKFIILTGYDEFAYAKEAIKYGVESYILKPINEEELQETLVKMVRDLDNKKKEKNKVLDKNTKLIEYIEGKLNEKYIYDMKNLLSIDIKDKAYTVSNINISRKYKDGIYINVSEILERYTEDKYEVLHKYDDEAILINSWDKEISRAEIINYYEDIKDKLIKESNEEIFISIGDIVFDIKELSKSYSTAKKLKKYILTEGTNKCVYKEKLKDVKEHNKSFKEEIEHINKLIIEKNISDLEKYISSIYVRKYYKV